MRPLAFKPMAYIPGRPGRTLGVFLLPALALLGCGGNEEAGTRWASEAHSESRQAPLGPRDGHGLPATDLDRVTVGAPAPDFTLLSLGGDRHTLSDYRGRKEVVLVFYRGHW